MLLDRLFEKKNKNILALVGFESIKISSLCFDSRKAGKGDVFFALKGSHVDGHTYINHVISAGVCAVVCEVLPEILHPTVCFIQVKDSAQALAEAASTFYDHPSEKLDLIGVTGTNGKTTTVTLLYNVFKETGRKSGLISTIRNMVDNEIIPSTHTTPDVLSINKLLAKMVEKNCTHCFMEVSSHAADQKRIAGLHFKGGVFTNITHDHLDYHKTFAAYLKAKKSFFDHLPKSAFALSNADDKNSSVILQNTKAKKYTYALKTFANFKTRVLENEFSGLYMEMDYQEVYCRLCGEFNAYNLTAIYAVGVLCGLDKTELLKILSLLKPAEGRFELIESESGIKGIVDYAHTPDALENVLNTISKINKENHRILCVVGAGGDRDRAKRPIMAQIAAKYSDLLILTSDNPRTEDPRSIIKEMEEGLKNTKKKHALIIQDREEAIKAAVLTASPGDVILLAGKGHETYQEIQGKRYHFDDKEVLKKYFKDL